ncbi:hypothetical protein NDU88_000309 [Pleurodeles waltl]|uniref:Uncharacterized protein n=1 Tax=Pleurodeles waltl TaxID=8319 RepID=A0AAV7MPB2_PLEWA|nr:hypothetical protein NDU88_000309 [Pleurodeles waltl]
MLVPAASLTGKSQAVQGCSGGLSPVLHPPCARSCCTCNWQESGDARLQRGACHRYYSRPVLVPAAPVTGKSQAVQGCSGSLSPGLQPPCARSCCICSWQESGSARLQREPVTGTTPALCSFLLHLYLARVRQCKAAAGSLSPVLHPPCARSCSTYVWQESGSARL